MRGLAADLQRLAVTAQAGGLDAETAERLRRSVLIADSDVAIREAAALLDPAGNRSAWDLAGEIERLLDRLEGAAYKRIAAGYRQPASPTEAACVRILACPHCPRSRKRLAERIGRAVSKAD